MLWRSLLPQSEVEGVLLILLTVELTGVGYYIVEVATRKDTIAVVIVILLDIEVD